MEAKRGNFDRFENEAEAISLQEGEIPVYEASCRRRKFRKLRIDEIAVDRDNDVSQMHSDIKNFEINMYLVIFDKLHCSLRKRNVELLMNLKKSFNS